MIMYKNLSRTISRQLNRSPFKVIIIVFIIWIIIDGFNNYGNIHSEYHASSYECYTQPEDQNKIVDIPKFMFEFIDKLVENDNFQINCLKERVNFVYGKTHKCASDTLAAIWRRFALSRNLSVVIPVKGKFLLGWPHKFNSYMHRPAKHEWGYNILVDHVVFNYSYISTLMPTDTVYFTTVREPFGRLSSSLSYHGMGKCGRIPPDLDITEEFLKDMFWYDNLYKSPDNRLNLTGCKCVPKGISVARNHMAFDLGFPTGWHFDSVDQQDNYTFIAEWLKEMYQIFDLIIPVERFNEGVVILKRYMCWSFKDILYKKLRIGKSGRKTEFEESQKHMFRQWSNVDTLLYYMVNETFNKRATAFGQDLLDEADEYVKQETAALDFCEFVSVRDPSKTLTVEATKWDKGYTVTYEDCAMIMDREHNRERLKGQHDTLNGDLYNYPFDLGLTPLNLPFC